VGADRGKEGKEKREMERGRGGRREKERECRIYFIT